MRWTGWRLAGALLSACSSTSVETPAEPPVTPSVQRTVLVDSLANPWGIAFTSNGTLFFTERARGVRVRLPDGTVRRYPLPADFVAQEQSGMLGIAVDPDFDRTRHIYVFMASRQPTTTDNRVVRWTVSADWTTLTDRRDVVTGIAYLNGAHSGGVLAFGPDGMLWITTGDNRSGLVPQNLQSLGGKVLRVTRDGAPAPGNPTTYPRPADPRIYAWGFRNVQGISFDPVSGAAFISEHGPDHSDEVTRVVAGGNGGWDPVCADGVSYCGYAAGMSMTDTVKFSAALRPTFRLADSEGMGGSTFITGTGWGTWRNAFAVTSLSGRRLRILALSSDRRSATELETLFAGVVRLRTVARGPDGALYVLTDAASTGQIWRLTPQAAAP